MTTIYIKNMVSNRCKGIVIEAMHKLGLSFTRVDLGEVDLEDGLTSFQRADLERALESRGLLFLEDRKLILVQKIKAIILQLAMPSDEPLFVNLSEYLSTHLHAEYTYLANLFSEMTGLTIERFFIWNKIERVKEMLAGDNITLTDIAFQMHYSSVAHISSQFKNVTGQTPTSFRRDRRVLSSLSPS